MVSFAGLLTVVLAAIQQVRNYKELAWRHKIAANEFSNLKRKIERYVATHEHEELKRHIMHALSKDYFHITKASPTIKSKTKILNPRPSLWEYLLARMGMYKGSLCPALANPVSTKASP